MKITKPMKPRRNEKYFTQFLDLITRRWFRSNIWFTYTARERYADGKSNILFFYSESPGCQNCLFFPSKYTVYHPKILSNSSIKVWYDILKIFFIFFYMVMLFNQNSFFVWRKKKLFKFCVNICSTHVH